MHNHEVEKTTMNRKSDLRIYIPHTFGQCTYKSTEIILKRKYVISYGKFIFKSHQYAVDEKLFHLHLYLYVQIMHFTNIVSEEGKSTIIYH